MKIILLFVANLIFFNQAALSTEGVEPRDFAFHKEVFCENNWDELKNIDPSIKNLFIQNKNELKKRFCTGSTFHCTNNSILRFKKGVCDAPDLCAPDKTHLKEACKIACFNNKDTGKKTQYIKSKLDKCPAHVLSSQPINDISQHEWVPAQKLNTSRVTTKQAPRNQLSNIPQNTSQTSDLLKDQYEHEPKEEGTEKTKIKPSPVLVLAIDGAAARGVGQMKIIQALYQEVSKSLPGINGISDIFNIAAGTSAGSINLAGMLTPREEDLEKINTLGGVTFHPRYSIDNLLTMAPNILKSTFQYGGGIRKVRTIGGLLGSKYSSKGLQKSLQTITNGTHMADTIIPVLITSHDIWSKKSYFFSTRKACADPAHNKPLWQAALSSGSAPVFFKPFVTKIAGEEKALVDAGLYVMNPGLLAYLESKQLFPNRDVMIVSISGGNTEQKRNLKTKGATAGNIPTVLQPTIEVCLEGSQDMVHQILQEIDGVAGYHRIDFKVESPEFDDISEKNMASINKSAENFIASAQFKIIVNDIIRVLQEQRQKHDKPRFICRGKLETPAFYGAP